MAVSPKYEQFRLSKNRREMIHSKFNQCNIDFQEVYWTGRVANGAAPAATEMDFQGIPGARLFIPADCVIFLNGSYVIMDENAYENNTALPVVGKFFIVVQRLGDDSAAVLDNTNMDLDGSGTGNNPYINENGAIASKNAATLVFDVSNQGSNESTYLRCRVTYNVANVAWKFMGNVYSMPYRTRLDQWNSRGAYGSYQGGRI